MAAFAVCTELAAMDVSVAVGTVCTHVLEHQAGVASGASNFLVHAAERVAGLVVIELGVRANWFPCGVRVAILTGRGDRSVRIGDLCLGSTYLRIRIAHRLL